MSMGKAAERREGAAFGGMVSSEQKKVKPGARRPRKPWRQPGNQSRAIPLRNARMLDTKSIHDGSTVPLACVASVSILYR
jgi:hypothetical protein